MAVYKPRLKANFGPISESDKFAGQATLSGTDPSIETTAKGAFFLEGIQAASGTLVLTDGNGNQILPAVGTSYLDFQHSPLICEGGLAITGSVAVAKGFVLEGILP
jgi:hypothetical protein